MILDDKAQGNISHTYTPGLSQRERSDLQDSASWVDIDAYPHGQSMHTRLVHPPADGSPEGLLGSAGTVRLTFLLAPQDLHYGHHFGHWSMSQPVSASVCIWPRFIQRTVANSQEPLVGRLGTASVQHSTVRRLRHWGSPLQLQDQVHNPVVSHGEASPQIPYNGLI